jgi:hypothetical protein
MSVISFILDADYRDKPTLLPSAAENNTVVYLIGKFIGVSVGLMPKGFPRYSYNRISPHH